MSPEQIGLALALILRGKGKPVTIYVRITPGMSTAEATHLIPVGQSAWEMAGTYTEDITLGEVAGDLNHAERVMQGRLEDRAALRRERVESPAIAG